MHTPAHNPAGAAAWLDFVWIQPKAQFSFCLLLAPLLVCMCVAPPSVKQSTDLQLMTQTELRGEMRRRSNLVATFLKSSNHVLLLAGGYAALFTATYLENKKIQAESRISAHTDTFTHFDKVMSDDWEGFFFVWVCPLFFVGNFCISCLLRLWIRAGEKWTASDHLI